MLLDAEYINAQKEQINIGGLCLTLKTDEKGVQLKAISEN